MTSERAALIAFAGLDGSGKTTQAMLLTQRLASYGVRTTFLPNVSLRDIRALLDRIAVRHGHPDHVDMLGPDTSRLIAAVAKWKTLAALPGLLALAGSVVVMDRSVICQYAAIRLLGAANEEIIREVFDDLPVPEITFFLDVPSKVAVERVSKRGRDTHAQESLEALRSAYRSLPEFPALELIDGNRPAEEVHRSVCAAVAARLPMPLGENQ